MQIKKALNKFCNILYVYVKYKEYLKFQYKSKEEITNVQEKKLKRILKIAVEKVPFYKVYKNKIDFDNFTLKELNKLPIVTKEDIREDIHRFLREDIKIDQLEWKSTSGSSGKPFKVPKSYYSDAIEVILGYRAWSQGKNIYKIREPAIVLRSFSPKEGEPLYKRDWLRNFWYLSPYDINDKHLDQYLCFIKKSKSKILKGYPSSIYILTLLLKKHNITLPQIETIITSSENMLPMYRNEIENYWKCDVLDWYGQNERTVTVQQCSEGNYHNNDEYGIVQLDNNNNIIATSLNNDIMPLLRYFTNDRAVPNNQTIQCSCGRNLTVPFKSIEGRADDIIYKEGKTPIPTVNFYNLMENFQKVKQFSLEQEEDLSINIQVSENEPLSNEDLDFLKEGIKQRVGNLKINITVVDQILRNKKTDKIKIIKSKVKV